MFCPECGAEYRAGFSQCSDCQIPLVMEEPSQAALLENVTLVEVFKADDLVTLSLAESSLKESGIEYVLRGDRFYAIGFPVNRPVGIRVSEEDEPRARDALAELEESGDVTVGNGDDFADPI